jgi:hypothetical protein
MFRIFDSLASSRFIAKNMTELLGKVNKYWVFRG